MTLQQLRYLIAVAEKGAITEAAKSLFISQPSLSNTIREVEQSIDFRIAEHRLPHLQSASNRRHIDREGHGISRPRSPGCMADGRAGIEIR